MSIGSCSRVQPKRLGRFVRGPTSLIVGVRIFSYPGQDAADKLRGYGLGRWGALLRVPQTQVVENLVVHPACGAHDRGIFDTREHPHRKTAAGGVRAIMRHLI